jgi:hypothetical protein
MPNSRHRPGSRFTRARRVCALAVVLALAAAPVASAAPPPHGSHGQETDTPSTATTPVSFSLAVRGICSHAMLFEQPHSIGTRTGAVAVASDIRASTQSRLVLVAALPGVPAQRPAVLRWLALERRLADTYARNYVHIYDLIATPRTPDQDARAARRLASLMHEPDRLSRAAARLEQQLRVPDCTGG